MNGARAPNLGSVLRSGWRFLQLIGSDVDVVSFLVQICVIIVENLYDPIK